MNTLSSSEARQHFPEVVSKAAYGKKRIIVTRRGKRLAAIIPIEDLDLIEAIENHIDLEDARKALASVNKHGSTSWKKVKADLGL